MHSNAGRTGRTPAWSKTKRSSFRAPSARTRSSNARAESASITQRVAIQRDLAFRGLYWSQADALARAMKWRTFLQAGPRMFRVTTDRYLHQVECGHIGRITYPAFGLSAGVKCTVVGWEEQLAARRLALTIVTQPET